MRCWWLGGRKGEKRVEISAHRISSSLGCSVSFLEIEITKNTQTGSYIMDGLRLFLQIHLAQVKAGSPRERFDREGGRGGVLSSTLPSFQRLSPAPSEPTGAAMLCRFVAGHERSICTSL